MKVPQRHLRQGRKVTFVLYLEDLRYHVEQEIKNNTLDSTVAMSIYRWSCSILTPISSRLLSLKACDDQGAVTLGHSLYKSAHSPKKLCHREMYLQMM